MDDDTHTLTTLDQLADNGLIAPSDRDALRPVADRYAIAVTPAMQNLIRDGSAAIAAQFVPDGRELDTHPSELADPIGDDRHSPAPGLVHRHPDRVLFKIVSICPVYCRFCFRREMVGPGSTGMLSAAEIDDALAYIASHDEIWEVIFTGGDPLVLSPRRIADLVRRLSTIPHVRIIRWHSRVPVVAPDRITDDLIDALLMSDQAVYVSVHANHADEFTPEARAAIGRLADAGIPLLSQTVLLKGVNDDITTLSALMRTFVELRIKPYYLHHCDLAPGTSHFRTSLAHGRKLAAELRATLSGLAQPAYVLDLPGGFAKIPLLSADVLEKSPGRYQIRDGEGRLHDYEDAIEQPAA